MKRFSFGEAFMHFSRTEGKGRFFLPFVLSAFAMLSLISLISLWLNAPIYEVYGEMIASGAGGDEPDMLAFSQRMNELNTRSLLAMAITMPLYIVFWAMLESAVYRRYMRADAFGLRLGPDEFRLMVIGLLWVAFFIALYIGIIVALILPILIGVAVAQASPVLATIIIGISFIAFMLASGWVASRLAPASALTIRDEEIRAFDGWKATRGMGKTLLGVWVTWFIIQMLAFAVLMAIGFAMVIGRLAGVIGDGGVDDSEILRVVSQPAFWGPLVVLQLLVVLLQSVFHYIWAGPAALAAKTDPTWSGRSGIEAEFN